jgi:hypothetical protein
MIENKSDFMSDDEFWAEVQRRPRPLAQVPAGFPSTHSRYPAIVSPAHGIEQLPHREESIHGLELGSSDDANEWRAALRSILEPEVYLGDAE